MLLRKESEEGEPGNVLSGRPHAEESARFDGVIRAFP
jgi:hypothetical protein